MKKLIFALILFMLSLSTAHLVTAQKNAGGSSIQRNALLESATGLMAYSMFNTNNYLMELYTGNLMKKNELFNKAVDQENTLKFLIDQVDRVLNADISDLKKVEVRYFKDLKKTLVVLQKQAISLKEHINGNSGAKARFDTFKDLGWKQVTNVMSKQS
ncbi:MAG: hypothetical protein EOP54_04230 [Sphingobacteriales bacterium]|nr:MAG: hypothetical protein EOP54_04230 [Sphingobacteriales bacterium]